jgi:kynurenine formamidase
MTFQQLGREVEKGTEAVNRTIIDLSMPVHNDMVTFPRVVPPSLTMCESWQEFADRIGATEFGVGWLTAHYRVVIGDHIGTHMDAMRHMRDDAPGPEGIPLEYCYGNGVCLDFRHLPIGTAITVDDVKKALCKISYALKPFDIVLIHTGAGKLQDSERYLHDHVGMSGEATEWLIDQGIRMMGIDAATFDMPVWAMFEQKRFWEAHRVMLKKEYYHLENLTNLDQLPPFDFTLNVFPIKWVNTTGAPVRAVAILEE